VTCPRATSERIITCDALGPGGQGRPECAARRAAATPVVPTLPAAFHRHFGTGSQPFAKKRSRLDTVRYPLRGPRGIGRGFSHSSLRCNKMARRRASWGPLVDESLGAKSAGQTRQACLPADLSSPRSVLAMPSPLCPSITKPVIFNRCFPALLRLVRQHHSANSCTAVICDGSDDLEVDEYGQEMSNEPPGHPPLPATAERHKCTNCRPPGTSKACLDCCCFACFWFHPVVAGVAVGPYGGRANAARSESVNSVWLHSMRAARRLVLTLMSRVRIKGFVL
jgi:hypothetical protein